MGIRPHLVHPPFAMSELQNETRDYPMTRIIVWTAILASTATFWAVVALAFLAWLRIG